MAVSGDAAADGEAEGTAVEQGTGHRAQGTESTKRSGGMPDLFVLGGTLSPLFEGVRVDGAGAFPDRDDLVSVDVGEVVGDA